MPIRCVGLWLGIGSGKHHSFIFQGLHQYSFGDSVWVAPISAPAVNTSVQWAGMCVCSCVSRAGPLIIHRRWLQDELDDMGAAGQVDRVVLLRGHQRARAFGRIHHAQLHASRGETKTTPLSERHIPRVIHCVALPADARIFAGWSHHCGPSPASWWRCVRSIVPGMVVCVASSCFV
jgi:hypothetical protein